MGYTINSIVPDGDNKICISISFLNGQSGTICLPITSTEAEVLSKLDEIESGYPTVAQLKAAIPSELQDLVGYVKA